MHSHMHGDGGGGAGYVGVAILHFTWNMGRHLLHFMCQIFSLKYKTNIVNCIDVFVRQLF